jgi:hypothetical protein
VVGAVLVALAAGWAVLRLWHTGRHLALKRRAAELQTVGLETARARTGGRDGTAVRQGIQIEQRGF